MMHGTINIKFVERIKTHNLCSVTFSANRAFYEIMWKNRVETYRPHVAIQYCACAFLAG